MVVAIPTKRNSVVIPTAENVRKALENIAKFCDLQAEYEGSIPFTRSNVLKPLSPQPQSGANHASSIGSKNA